MPRPLPSPKVRSLISILGPLKNRLPFTPVIGTRPGTLSSSILIVSFPLASGSRSNGKASSLKKNLLRDCSTALGELLAPLEPARTAEPANGASSKDLELKLRLKLGNTCGFLSISPRTFRVLPLTVSAKSTFILTGVTFQSSKASRRLLVFPLMLN